MCTVTFIPRRRGYALAMNRDEQLTRPVALPPAPSKINGRNVVCPSEKGGGTWIALNEAGITVALINWYAITARVGANPVSRGEVTRAVAGSQDTASAERILGELPLGRINPFRLIGVFPEEEKIVEWQWELRGLQSRIHPWQANIWISSGFDEPGAQQSRRAVYDAACLQSSFGALDWLRRLHRSHLPSPGPYSVCMHRADAATVSCTEVSVAGEAGMMRYYDGPPCTKCRVHNIDLALTLFQEAGASG